MKVTQSLILASLALAGGVCGEQVPVVPTGFLDASALMVRAETNVDLNWKVNIPATKVEELIEIPDDEPTIIAKEDVAFEVRMLGAEYAWSGNYVLAYGQYTYGDSPWYTFFWGYGDDANALTKKTCDILRKGEELQFGFRGSKNGFRNMPWQHRKWHNYRWTGTGPSWYQNDNPAIILKDGDKLPKRATPDSQVDISTFLAPYLDESGKKVDIGPKDLIILAELNRDYGDKEADYQDFVILVTFTEAENSTCTRRWNGPPPPSPPSTPSTPSEPAPIPPKPTVPGIPE
ncbi:hypothetical protein [Roseibacillus persicicus]|uniref:Uncharacterized protein n=1 Tax=Roseibacillus persicicus TaxID=454148 RepID=A0A918WKC8_9BACT|nr:hypothetical protein [Roseibacillus persicicus]GHC55382.1 hypothetical protein GCM10007100_22430 [Roseibacillus persicicus]